MKLRRQSFSVILTLFLKSALVLFSGRDILANLDMLIRRTGRHPLPVEIIRNIVNKVSVTGFYTLRVKTCWFRRSKIMKELCWSLPL